MNAGLLFRPLEHEQVPRKDAWLSKSSPMLGLRVPSALLGQRECVVVSLCPVGGVITTSATHEVSEGFLCRRSPVTGTYGSVPREGGSSRRRGREISLYVRAAAVVEAFTWEERERGFEVERHGGWKEVEWNHCIRVAPAAYREGMVEKARPMAFLLGNPATSSS